jgi:UDP-2,3-diacylglucosamine hydrolase
MSITYFISDIHLGASAAHLEKERLQLFLEFLKEVEQKASKLFIVGDLFDFWFEYKYVIPKNYFSVLHQLKKISDKNVEIHYLTGNHDFWLGKFFDREMKIKTHENDWSGEIDGKRFYLFHGDGVAKNDSGYRFLKKILRNKFSLRIYSWLHPDVGIPFARFVSGSSRSYTNKINLKDDNDYIEFAKKKLNEGYDFVMMGHRHNPIEIKEEDKKYINLGDWLVNFSYAEFDGKSLNLKFRNK